MQFINQYSMLWTSVILLGVISFVLLRKGVTLERGLIILGAAVLFFGIWLGLRPDQATTVDLGDFQSELGNGQSVLLELQSPY
jgi:hypothetical protein